MKDDWADKCWLLHRVMTPPEVVDVVGLPGVRPLVGGHLVLVSDFEEILDTRLAVVDLHPTRSSLLFLRRLPSWEHLTILRTIPLARTLLRMGWHDGVLGSDSTGSRLHLPQRPFRR